MEESKESPDTQNLTAPHTPATKSTAEIRSIEKWQNKIVLWLIGMPTVLIVIFIYLASKQVDNFNQSVNVKSDTLLFSKLMPQLNGKITGDNEDQSKQLKWAVLAKLEQESVYRRYNQGGLLLMSRIFVKYFGFLTGMILAVLGAVFIIGKLSDNYSSLSGNFSEHVKFNLISSSPGIIFGILGTILMLSSILQHNEIVVQDSPLYFNSNNLLSITSEGYFSEKNATDKVLDASDADSIFSTADPNK